MGNINSIKDDKFINFEDMQKIINNEQNNKEYCLINTLPLTNQECIIYSSINASIEERTINSYLSSNNKHIKFIIYGKNSKDDTVYKKYYQLKNLGFHYIYIYNGGLFEWLLLQEIYGTENFTTIGKQLDILKYKQLSVL
jgi:hypothetical protein